MKIAILNNIYGNRYALESVLEDLEALKVKAVICLGNSIGFGPHDNQVLNALRKLRIIAHLKGDTEQALFDPKKMNLLNLYEASKLNIMKSNIASENLVYLDSCPIEYIHLKFYHFKRATTQYPDLICNQADLIKMVCQKSKKPIHITSFSDQNFLLQSNKNHFKYLYHRIINLQEEPCLINIGSISKPVAGSFTAKYAILDDDEGILEFKETKYDFTKTQKDMQVLGISKLLISKLTPSLNTLANKHKGS